jgi:hypothetical protein
MEQEIKAYRKRKTAKETKQALPSVHVLDS